MTLRILPRPPGRLAWRTLFSIAALASGCGTSPPPESMGPVTGGPLTSGEDAADMREALGAARAIEMRSESEVVTLRVLFDAGSAEDPEGLAGLTHLTARLMTEGGTEELSYAELSERLFPMAAHLSVHVSRDQTVFVGRVHRDHLDAFYPVFRDVLAAPRMAQGDFDRVIAQAQSELELELRGNDDEELGKEVLQAMLYEGHPFEHPVLGTESGLGAIDLAQVHTQRDRVFCGPRATVGLAGGYPEGLAQRLTRDVATIRSDACVGRLRLPEPPTQEGPRIWLVHKPEASAVAVSMGMPLTVARGHQDYPALMLATAYLGQHRQFTGVLMQKMRGQRGLNYGDYAYAEHFEQDGWTRFPLPNTQRRQQYFSIWLRPVRPEQAHFAIRMAVRELRRFVEAGLSDADFERVRDFAIRYHALYLQTESRRLGFRLDDDFHGLDQPFLERLTEAWRQMTADDVNAAIRRHIDPAGLQVALVTPGAEELAGRLASEEPSPIEYPATVSEEVRAEDLEIIPYRIGIPRSRMHVLPVADTFR